MTNSTQTDETDGQEPEITDDVIEQLADVRDTGLTNMWDKEGVREVADTMGHTELVAFVEAAGPDKMTDALKQMGRYRQDRDDDE